MKNRIILLLDRYMTVAENAVAGMLVRIRRCPFASVLILTTVVFYGIAFFLALEQSIIMASNLAKLEIMLLVGFPTLLAVLAIIVGSSCGLNRDDRV